MKLKCPLCNGCLDFVWKGNCRFFRCDFCNKLYNIVGNKIVEVESVDLHIDINGNPVVQKVNYVDGS
jgi:hypothetical protein